MECLSADFIQSSRAIAIFFFFKGDWALDSVCNHFHDFTKIFSFSKLLDIS